MIQNLVSGFRPQTKNIATSQPKTVWVGMTKVAALEYSKYNIRVNSVAPSAIDTPMLQGALEHFEFDLVKYAKKLNLLGRFGRPEEIAHVSDYASYVTGTTVTRTHSSKFVLQRISAALTAPIFQSFIIPWFMKASVFQKTEHDSNACQRRFHRTWMPTIRTTYKEQKSL